MTQKVSSNSIVSLNASKLTGPHSNATDGSNLTNINDGMIESASDPTTSSNPTSGLGTLWVNHTSGEMYCCTDATTNANVWTNVGAGTGDVINQGPTNATNGGSFPDINKNSSQTFIFSGGTDPDGSVTHYMVDQFSNAALSVSAAEVTATSAHTFNAGAVGSDTAVTFRVRSKDNNGAYSSGVTVSMTVLNVVYTTATGGSIGTSGNYKYHVFTSTGQNFAISQIGTDNTVEYLVVAGGGGGGNRSNAGGGGGAGGYRTGNMTVAATSYPVTVGAPGAANGGNGSTSTFHNISSTGGGGGANANLYPSPPNTGGSGGGGNSNPYFTGASGNAGGYSPVEGYNGGNGTYVYNASYGTSGGGGGAGAIGSNGIIGSGNPPRSGGAGGVGKQNLIAGTGYGQSGYYAGGGGGASYTGTGIGPGGNGGGGNGAVGNAQSGGSFGPTAGAVNTGGGGGGNAYNGSQYSGGMPGGKGIVIVKYKYQ